MDHGHNYVLEVTVVWSMIESAQLFSHRDSIHKYQY